MSTAIVSITGWLVKQIAAELNICVYMTGLIYASFTFVRRACVGAAFVVLTKQREANSSVRASLCGQESPRLLCL